MHVFSFVSSGIVTTFIQLILCLNIFFLRPFNFNKCLTSIPFQASFWGITCERQVHRIRKQFFNAILRQEIGWFDTQQSGELTTRLAE